MFHRTRMEKTKLVINYWYKFCDFVEFKLWPNRLEILVLTNSILCIILIIGLMYSIGVDCV